MPMLDVKLQDRDYVLFRGLLDSRVMSLTHAAQLYFGGNQETAKKRTQKLKASGHLGERARKPGDPSILHLTKKSFLALKDAGRLPTGRKLTWEFLEGRPRVSDLTLRHELEVMDAKVAFCHALASRPQLTLAEFTTWPMFYQFHAVAALDGNRQERQIKPDGFIRIGEKDGDDQFEHTFFLEVDRSTETQDTLVQKALCYQDYYRSGNFAVRMGARREDFNAFPFRVLLVVKNEERRNNAAERLLLCNPPILTMVRLTTSEELQSDALGSVWITPKDYLVATKDTAFDPQTRDFGPGYRRQSERETLVRGRVAKGGLL